MRLWWASRRINSVTSTVWAIRTVSSGYQPPADTIPARIDTLCGAIRAAALNSERIRSTQLIRLRRRTIFWRFDRPQIRLICLGSGSGTAFESLVSRGRPRSSCVGSNFRINWFSFIEVSQISHSKVQREHPPRIAPRPSIAGLYRLCLAHRPLNLLLRIFKSGCAPKHLH